MSEEFKARLINFKFLLKWDSRKGKIRYGLKGKVGSERCRKLSISKADDVRWWIERALWESLERESQWMILIMMRIFFERCFNHVNSFFTISFQLSRCCSVRIFPHYLSHHTSGATSKCKLIASAQAFATYILVFGRWREEKWKLLFTIKEIVKLSRRKLWKPVSIYHPRKLIRVSSRSGLSFQIANDGMAMRI